MLLGKYVVLKYRPVSMLLMIWVLNVENILFSSILSHIFLMWLCYFAHVQCQIPRLWTVLLEKVSMCIKSVSLFPSLHIYNGLELTLFHVGWTSQELFSCPKESGPITSFISSALVCLLVYEVCTRLFPKLQFSTCICYLFSYEKSTNIFGLDGAQLIALFPEKKIIYCLEHIYRFFGNIMTGSDGYFFR